MATFNYVMVKTMRITAWPLLVLMILYLVTGYVLCGQLRLGLMDVRKALAVHRLFDVPLVALFLAHSLPAIYLAIRRWGWIGRRTKP